MTFPHPAPFLRSHRTNSRQLDSQANGGCSNNTRLPSTNGDSPTTPKTAAPEEVPSMRPMSHSSSRIETRIPGAKAFWGEVIEAAMNGGIQKIRRARVKVISLEALAVPKTRPYGTVAHFGMRPFVQSVAASDNRQTGNETTTTPQYGQVLGVRCENHPPNLSGRLGQMRGVPCEKSQKNLLKLDSK